MVTEHRFASPQTNVTNQTNQERTISHDYIPLPTKSATACNPWGDFSPGRWLWLLADVEALPNPAPAIGHQSFWHWNPHGG